MTDRILVTNETKRIPIECQRCGRQCSFDPSRCRVRKQIINSDPVGLDLFTLVSVVILLLAIVALACMWLVPGAVSSYPDQFVGLIILASVDAVAGIVHLGNF